ncbi:hypothetical protein SLEP1_g58334 [Rubroshorea leprosula]|uniref:Uncharacterized protein n=1 Tax=Rubroshorea leprosula TaxID=152421 RepID=A0AAV5MQH6_9ROSI|nr:hypothetical protein SLEP1_g58334 [Rubroshorea leprosula]
MEEGVGRNEMTGVEGDSVPITVVKVEGGSERCYDVDADIVSEVRQYESEFETRDSLGYLVESYEISSRVLIRPAGVEERACSAPRDHWMPMYAHYLAAGLRFPIPELLVGLLLDYSIGLAQLAPNAMRWEREDAEVELLSSWKAKKANQNKYSLNEDEEEEVGKLVREGGNLVNIMYLTSANCIEAAELYGPSALNEGVAIPKKLRKKSKTSTKEASKVGAGKELVPSTTTGVQEVGPRLELKRKGSEALEALQKKKKVMEQEVGGNEVLEFVPRPPPVELNLELRESEVEGAEVRAPGKGKVLVPPLSFQSNLFDAKNAIGARRFINATFPKVDKCQDKEEVLRYVGATVMRHALEKEKNELEKKNKNMQEALDEVVPTVKQLEQEKDSLSTKLVFEERKRKISESEREAQEKEIKMMKEAVVELKKNVQLLVHMGWRSISATSRKVKVEYPKVDITKITFGKKEEGVKENSEIVEKEQEEVEGAGVEENQPPLPVEVHSVPSDEE